MHHVRAAAAPLALKLKWTTLFSYRFFAGKHINLLELESLISLQGRMTRAGIRGKRLLVLLDSRGLGRALVSRLLRCTGIGMGVYLGKPSGCPFTERWKASLPRLPCVPTAALASAPPSLGAGSAL